MSVSPEKGVYKCFVCGNAGNVFNFVMEYEKVSFYKVGKKYYPRYSKKYIKSNIWILNNDPTEHKVY